MEEEVGSGSGCYKSGKAGHFGRDSTAPAPAVQMTDLICFHCNQRGHKRANCPRLTAVPAAAQVTATARVIDGRKVKEDVPVVQSRAFQLTAEEARAAPDVVTGMILSLGVTYMMFVILICALFRIVPCERYSSSGIV